MISVMENLVVLICFELISYVFDVFGGVKLRLLRNIIDGILLNWNGKGETIA